MKELNSVTNPHAADFNQISIKLASPERILDWSHGEVTKPETINYRTQRSEKDGLFDQKIFGPEKDYECYCGKYKGIRYKGIECEKCGVEVTRSIVRRERMGHIELSAIVSHVWFLRGVPSRMALVLGVKASDIEKVIYFAGYIVTTVNEDERTRISRELETEYKTKIRTLKDEKSKDALKELYVKTKKEIESIQKGVIIEDIVYNKFALRYGSMFEAEIGAEAIYKLFKNIDLNALVTQLEEEYEKTRSQGTIKVIKKRLSLVRGMVKAGVRPEWMFLERIPVLPPALRPMVALDGGRHATSDVNDLYRRVINRNNRLKKLKDINAPHVILRNEMRILQEAVDALIDNSIRRRGSYAASGQASRRPLKSLSDNLKSKQGIFRQNLLGKRVDYSGRSVIVVGPDLDLDECGIPKHMALELFRPFVIAKLLETELAFNIRGANKLIDDGVSEVWALLEEVISGKYVLLNRAPTLHRLGIQAFRPRLIEGDAIQVHPLVCSAFNADFDGDQMAVHVPLSSEAQLEAREIMASNKNILKPGTGRPVVSAKMLDIVLGCYWMTKIIDGKKGEGMRFPNPNYAITAFDFGAVDFRAKIQVMPTDTLRYAQFNGELFETSVGRLLFNAVLPNDFPYVNKEIDSKLIQVIVDDLIEHYGIGQLPKILDRIKNFGFKYATYAGITWGIDSIQIPEEKGSIIDAARAESEQVFEHYNDGLLSDEERYRKNIQIWHEAKTRIEKLIPDTLDPNGSTYDMWKSGARGSLSALTTMSGMKGLIENNQGRTIEFPVITSSSEGHTPIEYFITTHGSRKGLTDTALQTAKAGYLTRRLFDVAQDVVVTEDDCKTKDSITIAEENHAGIVIPLSKNLKGRYIANDIASPTGETLFKRGHLMTQDDATAVEEAGVKAVPVRSPMTCATERGVCAHCYGIDLGTNEKVALGEAVGTVAAQAIGEPGTQLTMRTFHQGGTASKTGDITSGLPRVEEIFEVRIPKSPAVVSRVNGTVTDIKEDGKERIITVVPDLEDRKKVSKKDTNDYGVSYGRTIHVKVGDTVKKGQLLTDGSAHLRELFKYAGKISTQEYIISEVNKIYELQGASISRKHLEVIIGQMFSRVKVSDPGDTKLSYSDVVETDMLRKANEESRLTGGTDAKVEPLLMGITQAALTRDSFLSAASFQHTTRILINAAVRGNVDELRGLKENVIIGRLIPAGTGFPGSPKRAMIDELHREESQQY